MQIKIIVAIDKVCAIGTKENTIPWDFHPEDMKMFSRKTKSEGGVVLMGRKTFLSLPEQFRPLPNRRNIVLSRDKDFKHDGVEVARELETLLEKLEEECLETLWVGGGGEIYQMFFELADELHISHFEVEAAKGSVFFPEIKDETWEAVESTRFESEKGAPNFTHKVYKRREQKKVSTDSGI